MTKSKHVQVWGTWLKSLDYKNKIPLKDWLPWNFQKISFAPKMDLKRPNPDF
jgi:hypothetical protein